MISAWPPKTLVPPGGAQNVHTAALRHMRFIGLKHAQFNEAHHPLEADCVKVFIGQLSKGDVQVDTTLIAGFVNQLVGKDDAVVLVNSRPDKPGVAWVTLPYEFAELLLQWHKRMLFDVLGVWIAQDNNQMAEMNHYVATQRKVFPQELPRKPMVIERDETLHQRNARMLAEHDRAAATSMTRLGENAGESTVRMTPACKSGHVLQCVPEAPDAICDVCHMNTTGRPVYSCAAVAPMCAKVVCITCALGSMVSCVYTPMEVYQASAPAAVLSNAPDPDVGAGKPSNDDDDDDAAGSKRELRSEWKMVGM